ncbi:tripartite tricarboxylate transporter substrate binding protein [Roseospira visakhapatnamensis]|uniref:Tripartite-type tricarboxylate transporter receptor subunit TctC n=1 Tax=Roseospira visakhapatnamensis TaxID=390880 RepID=A0A7W6RBW0_9PROT|nr:tripartite tricarboxylate transporter substrate binding protein [Roseospira visakhapatnamensis]MBB4265644.1 tripartite-type tricarboxylate transporter receptor subunit TctC [Roseospira visakhapatnamensis]
MKVQTVTILSAAALALASPAAHAEWPEQAITLIVAYSPGGGTDTTARTLAPLLEKELGTDIVVVNRPGASGEIGYTAIATAEPDGYTMGILNVPPAITIPITRDTRVSLDDVMPIANLIEDPSAFSVAHDSPFRTLEDLVAYAAENPASVTVAITGVGTDDHLAVVYFEQATGIDLTPVPFPGSGPARIALMGGHVSMAAINLGGMMPYTDSVRILAHFGGDRTDLAPDIPTVRESGWDVTMTSERGVAFPAGVPDALVTTVAAAVERVATSRAWKDALAQQFTVDNFMGPDAFAAHLHTLDTSYRALWADNPWQ